MIDRLFSALYAAGLVEQLQRRAIGQPADQMLSVSTPLPGDWPDLLALLPADQPYWYFSRPKDGEQRLAIGHAWCIERSGAQRFAKLDSIWQQCCARWQHDRPGLALLGFSFADDSPPPWPAARLAVPRLLLEQQAGHCQLTLSALVGELRNGQQPFFPWPVQPALPLPALHAQPDPAADRAWLARVAQALQAIERGHVDKLVLAHCRALCAEQPVPVASLLHRLMIQQPAALIYAHGQAQQVFLGATPERLCRRRGDEVDADALAGTAWPGSPELASTKNQQEQFFVAHAVDRALAPWCLEPPHISPPVVHRAGHLQHLHGRIDARLRPGVSTWALIAALHPTPAVGGFPVDAARHWLANQREHRPAWFSGGLGYLTSDGDCDIHVALRGASLNGPHITLPAGAGIVAGAEATLELAETHAKMAIMLNALNGHLPATLAQQNEGLEAYT